MKHQISTSTAPAVSVSYMTDPTAVRDSMQVIDQDVISLGQKPFLAKRVMVKLENSVLLFQQTSHRVRSHTTVGSNMMAYAAIGPRAKGTLDGIRMRPELLIIAAPGSEGEMVVDAGYSSVSLLIPPEDLLDHLSVRGRGDEFFMPNRADFLRIGGLGTRPYFDLGKRITQSAERQPKLFNDNESVRIAAYTEILESLLTTLDHKSDFKLTPEDRRTQNYSRIIKTVEDHLWSDAENRLYVSDLCSAAGVSERTLQYAFYEVLGTTPMAYIKIVRLHQARAELRAASSRDTTVSAIALNWGFWHFGDFSQAYKKCFQEMPSETLKKQSINE